jgi:hypothetical protein
MYIISRRDLKIDPTRIFISRSSSAHQRHFDAQCRGEAGGRRAITADVMSFLLRINNAIGCLENERKKKATGRRSLRPCYGHIPGSANCKLTCTTVRMTRQGAYIHSSAGPTERRKPSWVSLAGFSEGEDMVRRAKVSEVSHTYCHCKNRHHRDTVT